MEIIRGIPDIYLYAAFLTLSFLLFYAGGTALDQSAFYGTLFIIIAMILFFTALYIGKKARGRR